VANIFEKGTKFAATALALLRREVKAPGLFTNKYGIADFKGSEGDVLNIKRPPVLRARDKGWRNDNAITFDRLVQTKIQVRLDKHPYSAVELSPEEETLDEVDYVRDVQAPQVRAILEWFEDLVVAALAAADYVYEVVFNPSSGTAKENDPRKVASRARKYFQDAHVPVSGRYWLVGSSVAEAIRDNDKLLDVDTAGLPEALRDGVVTKLSGFIVVELDGLAEDESYFVHDSAIAIVTVAPVVPQGATKGGGVAAGNGLAVTQLWDYDSDHLKDRSIVHALAGATAVLDPELDDNDQIILDVDDNPQLEFVRGIKVIFGAAGNTAVWTIAVTGTPTGGTFSLTVDGDETEAIAFDASESVVKAALNAIEGVSGVKVTGTTTKTITFTEFVTLALSDNNLTGGTTPSVTVTAV
jgi:hypothetical protein